MRNIVAITMKELRTYFRTPIAYVIIALFLALTGWLFFVGSKFFIAGEASMRAFFEPLPWIFLFFIPAITMRLWSEEKKVGTIEVLFTMPVRSYEAVLGKFFGAVLMVAVMLALSFSIPAIVAYVGNPDFGPIWGGYIGALLLASAYIAIGLFASALTENQIIAFLIAVVIGFAFFILDNSGVESVLPGFAKQLSLNYHFDSIGRGVVDLRDLMFYASFCAVFLILTSGILRGLRRAAALTFGIATVGLVLLNVLLIPVRARLDLTEGKVFTLHADTKKLLERVDDDLNVRVYLTPSNEMPPQFATLPRDIRDSLDEFKAYAKGRLNMKIIDTSASQANKDEAQKAGIFPIRASVMGSEELTVKEVYLGAVVEYGDKTEKLDGINPETLEYDLAVAISKVTRATAPQIAFNVTNAMPPGLPPQFRQQFQQENKDKHDIYGDYDIPRQLIEAQFGQKAVRTVKLDEAIPSDVQTLVVCNPSGVNDVGQFYIDQFLMHGGRVMFLVDGANFDQGSMRGMPRDDKWDALFSHYGFKVNKDIVLDEQCQIAQVPSQRSRGGIQFMNLVPYPAWMTVTDLDQKHPITRGLKELFMPFAASIEITPPPGVEGQILARSTDKAWKQENVFMLSPTQKIEPPEKGQQKFNLMAVLTGKWKSYYADHPLPESLQPKKEEPKAEEPKKEEGKADAKPDDKKQAAAPSSKEPEAQAKEKESKAAESGDKPDGDHTPSPPPSGGNGGISQETDVPGGGILMQEASPPQDEKKKPEDAPKQEQKPELPKEDATKPAPVTPIPTPKIEAPPLTPPMPGEPGAATPGTEVKKPPEVIKESEKPSTIVVIGTTEMFGGQYSRAPQNPQLFANATEYLTVGDELLGVRSRSAPSRKFQPLESGKKKLLQVLGMGLVPVLTVVFGAVSYVYRRNTRRKGVSL